MCFIECWVKILYMAETQVLDLPTHPKPEQPIATDNFDTRLRGLFADRPSALTHIESVIEAPDHFTDNWWNGLYKWLDNEKFHNEKQSISRITVESLDTLPPDAKLPKSIRLWISNVNGIQGQKSVRKQILDTLRNPSIPLSLRSQLGKHLAESRITPYSVDEIMQAYRILGEDVGEEVKKQIFPLMLAGLAYDQFEPYREDLIKLYEQEIVPSHSQTDQKKLAEKRVETIRDLVLELFPPTSNPFERWKHSDSYSNITAVSATNAMGSDLSTLPVETLGEYLSDLRKLKPLPEFLNLQKILLSIANEGIIPPYVALGKALSSHSLSTPIPSSSILNYLNELSQSGILDDRIIDNILLGISKSLVSNDGIKAIARRNMRILIKYQLSEEKNTFLIPNLLTISEENLLKDGLETVLSIKAQDKITASILLSVLPKFRVFGDKYNIVLDYIRNKKEREDLRNIGNITHIDYVSEALKKIKSTDSGMRQGERLIRFAASLDAMAKSNEERDLDIPNSESMLPKSLKKRRYFKPR